MTKTKILQNDDPLLRAGLDGLRKMFRPRKIQSLGSAMGFTKARFKRSVLKSRKGRGKALSGIKQGRVMNEGTGGQYSMYVGRKGKSFLPPHVENALAPQTIQSNAALQVKSAIGLQAVSNLLGVFLPALATTFTSDKITRVLYERATADVTLNNIYLSNAYLIIYDIETRKDLGVSTFTNPQGAWNQGVTDLGTGAALTFLGSTPWQSEAFNQYYQVKQVTNVVLGAGATHVHKVRLHPRKIVSSAYAQYTPVSFKDCSYYCMIEIHGSPANDTVTQTQVSVGVGGVNIIVDLEQTIKQLAKATPVLTTNNALLGSFTNAEQVVNLGGSAIQAQAEG